MRIAYPLEVSKSRKKTVRIEFPDIPEAWTECPKGEEQQTAVTLLVDVLEERIGNRREIPKPSLARGRDLVDPPVLVAAKVALYQAMHEQEMSNVALARELGTVEGTVRRLINLRHRSHIDQVEAALRLLGKRLVVGVQR